LFQYVGVGYILGNLSATAFSAGNRWLEIAARFLYGEVHLKMAFTDFNSPDEVQQAYSITYTEEEFLYAASRMPSEAFLQKIFI
jgi:hypothetical protein